MLTVGAFEAKAKIASLLDKVSEGESVLITRHGQAAAMLVPPVRAQQDRQAALEEIRGFRMACRTGPVDVEALIDEDRP
ncbi:MAG: type II toxin-antitoxin system prevent-host-death family antitoxin [Thiobacillaceae bacterium]|jgi:prevent-host-death family protein|nr:type II toxin-antitoxin system prevent-host-death family antitoxin [Thiobacillaceae bacterium]